MTNPDVTAVHTFPCRDLTCDLVGHEWDPYTQQLHAEGPDQFCITHNEPTGPPVIDFFRGAR